MPPDPTPARGKGAERPKMTPLEDFFEAHPLANKIRYVTSRRWFKTRTARLRAFWHYIVRRYPWEICGHCGRPAARGIGDTYWQAPDELWEAVNGSPWGVMCTPCFTREAQRSGNPIHWEAIRGI